MISQDSTEMFGLNVKQQTHVCHDLSLSTKHLCLLWETQKKQNKSLRTRSELKRPDWYRTGGASQVLAS